MEMHREDALSPSRAVGVIGSGIMGSGIAAVALLAGHPVVIVDQSMAALERGAAAVDDVFVKAVKRERISLQVRDECLARLTIATELSAIGDCALVVEAVVEDLDVKRNLFRSIEALVSVEAILATNTSSISVTAIAAGLARPERFAGFHFFNPAPVLPLVEIVSGAATAPSVAAILYETAKVWGKAPVHCRSTPGFIVNRVARPYYGEALIALEQQAASPATIDAVMTQAGGFRMGPLELMDLIGHDTNFAVTNTVWQSFHYDPRYRPSLVQRELVDAGWLGRKSGRGFYVYLPEHEKRSPEDAVSTITFSGDVALEGQAGEELVQLAEARGMTVQREEGAGYLRAGRAYLAFTDGRSATQRAYDDAIDGLVLVDLCFDFMKSERVAIAVSCQAPAEAIADAVSFLTHLGKTVSIIGDMPGMLVARSWAMLANEAAEAVQQGVASPDDVDMAMMKGVNYPVGPYRWLMSYGPRRVARILDNLGAAFPDGRYRVSQHIRSLALASATSAAA